MRLILTLPLAILASAVYGEDLIKDAPKITNTKSYVSAASVSWASIFYQVNMNINDAKYLGKPGDYEKAVRLYGTTALPAAFVPTWPAGYLSRAQALAGSQTPTLTPTPTSTHKPTSTPSPTSTLRKLRERAQLDH
ncbi:hypothetical protein DL89DRAFT_87533 [Linderina pennispora]|uniref:Uncharacterized protein n=1 Tax=Linderina pennispora TaxID=61395 RepID=A0A1Y1WIY8_9FUNG|nr:uncharacterized protein DL89DRAFT_87533 [Linderina pennispora]ORX73064.1 hypothetical protein DL89DRAFT_87533 [Linderina pennispora]